MPYRTVAGTRKRVPSLKNMSDHQVRIFIRVFNSLIKSGTNEKDAFPQAIGQASKFKKKMQTKTNKQMKVNKMLYKELEDALEFALEDKYCIKIDNPYSMTGEQECSPEVKIEDFDDTSVYFEIEGTYFKESYSYDESKQEVTLADNAVEVIEQTSYVEKADSKITTQMKSMFEDFLTKCAANFGGSNKQQQYVDDVVPVIKQFAEEKMEAIEPLYCLPDEVDLHGEAMDETEIRKMVDSLNRNILKGNVKGNINHNVNTDKITPIKAWVNECDCFIGTEFVPEGQPIIKMKFHDEILWKARKDGIIDKETGKLIKLNGVSIGARGVRVEKE